MLIIPIGGIGNRFRVEGYTIPKHLLTLKGKPILWHTINGFKKLLDNHQLVLILREEAYSMKEEYEKILADLQIENYDIFFLGFSTRGQAETVFEYTKNSKSDEEVYVFNADSFYVDFPVPELDVDGFLDTVNEEGNHWSFVAAENGKVTRVVEKERVSDNCSTGLYYFKSSDLFNEAYQNTYLGNVKSDLKEHYIAPIYNYMIARQQKVDFRLLSRDEIVFCGTPKEYEQELKKFGE